MRTQNLWGTLLSLTLRAKERRRPSSKPWGMPTLKLDGREGISKRLRRESWRKKEGWQEVMVMSQGTMGYFWKKEPSVVMDRLREIKVRKPLEMASWLLILTTAKCEVGASHTELEVTGMGWGIHEVRWCRQKVLLWREQRNWARKGYEIKESSPLSFNSGCCRWLHAVEKAEHWGNEVLERAKKV